MPKSHSLSARAAVPAKPINYEILPRAETAEARKARIHEHCHTWINSHVTVQLDWAERRRYKRLCQQNPSHQACFRGKTRKLVSEETRAAKWKWCYDTLGYNARNETG